MCMDVLCLQLVSTFVSLYFVKDDSSSTSCSHLSPTCSPIRSTHTHHNTHTPALLHPNLLLQCFLPSKLAMIAGGDPAAKQSCRVIPSPRGHTMERKRNNGLSSKATPCQKSANTHTYKNVGVIHNTSRTPKPNCEKWIDTATIHLTPRTTEKTRTTCSNSLREGVAVGVVVRHKSHVGVAMTSFPSFCWANQMKWTHCWSM